MILVEAPLGEKVARQRTAASNTALLPRKALSDTVFMETK
jgi:hypothetical protein